MRNGSITSEGYEVLKAIKKDFDVLQMDERIDDLIKESIVGYERNSGISEPIKAVKDDLISLFTEASFSVQGCVRRNRRNLDNGLCFEKCQTGPAIYNFTTFPIPDELRVFLEQGLNNVPDIAIKGDVVASEIMKDVRLACRNVYRAVIGQFPRRISEEKSLDTFLKI